MLKACFLNEIHILSKFQDETVYNAWIIFYTDQFLYKGMLGSIDLGCVVNEALYKGFYKELKINCHLGAKTWPFITFLCCSMYILINRWKSIFLSHFGH